MPVARFNTDSGQLELYAVKKIVTDVTDAATQISLQEAQQLYGDDHRLALENADSGGVEVTLGLPYSEKGTENAVAFAP